MLDNNIVLVLEAVLKVHLWFMFSLQEEQEFFSSVSQLKGSITQICQWAKVEHEHLSRFKNKCQCLWIDYVRIFNLPDLFTEKFLDIYGGERISRKIW